MSDFSTSWTVAALGSARDVWFLDNVINATRSIVTKNLLKSAISAKRRLRGLRRSETVRYLRQELLRLLSQSVLVVLLWRATMCMVCSFKSVCWLLQEVPP